MAGTDYNIDPLPLWEGPPYSDDATRRGMNEAKYINGLYTFWRSVIYDIVSFAIYIFVCLLSKSQALSIGFSNQLVILVM